MIDEARGKSGKLTNASSASGSPGHVGGELFKVDDRHRVVTSLSRRRRAAPNDLIAGT